MDLNKKEQEKMSILLAVAQEPTLDTTVVVEADRPNDIAALMLEIQERRDA